MSETGLLLAVDGGGTKTQALVTDLQGRVLARGLGPGSNVHNVGFDQSCKAVTTAIEGALLQVVGVRSAGGGQSWRGAPIAAACFGLAGVDAPEDEAEIARWVRQQTIAERFLVVNDAATLPASFRAQVPDGAQLEVRLLMHLGGPRFSAVLFGAGDWRTPTEKRPLPPKDFGTNEPCGPA